MSTITTNIYVLKLKEGRYYVGSSDNVDKRYQEHLDGKGSSWTKKYKPIALEKTHKNVSSFEEDKVTKQYMSKYGINKVRGGSYVKIKLSEEETNSLKKEIRAANGECTQCGRKGHFVKDCYAKTEVERKGDLPSESETESEEDEEDEDECEQWECEYCDRTFTTHFGCTVHERTCKTKGNNVNSDACYRCGRQGHYASDCYARRHVNGHAL
jgi:predicted GIY-YIG superfamily endonuclease